MTFKITVGADVNPPDFDTTAKAGESLRRNVDYKPGVAGGKELLETLYSEAIQGSGATMYDGSGSVVYDTNGEPQTLLILGKDEDHRRSKVFHMSLPEGRRINTDYVEQILDVVKSGFDGGKAPSDQDMKDFMLGIILLSKCR